MGTDHGASRCGPSEQIEAVGTVLVNQIIMFFSIFANVRAELGSVKVLRGSLYLVEAGLLESRLDLHTFIREHMLRKVANAWLWFYKTYSEYDSPTERQVIMPSLGDVVRGCGTGRLAIESLVKEPFGEDGKVSLLLLRCSFHLLRYHIVEWPRWRNQYSCHVNMHWHLLC